MIRATALVLLIFGIAGDAAAASEAHAEPNWRLLILQIINVFVLAFVLFRFARQPLQEFLKNRAAAIRDRLEDSQDRLRRAEADLKEIRERLDGFEAEANRMVGDAEEQARASAARIMERAEEQATRIRNEASIVATQEVSRARGELQREASNLAISMAGEILREKMTLDIDRRLVGEYIQKVEERA